MYKIYIKWRTEDNRQKFFECEEIESIFDGKRICDIYKKKYKSLVFVLINMDNGDLEYETPTIY